MEILGIHYDVQFCNCISLDRIPFMKQINILGAFLWKSPQPSNYTVFQTDGKKVFPLRRWYITKRI